MTDRSASRLFALLVLGFVLTNPGCGSPAVAHAATVASDTIPAPSPPSGLVYFDVPGDAGRALDLRWTRSGDDRAGSPVLAGYVLLRGASPSGPWAVIDSVGAGTDSVRDVTAHHDSAYYYRIAASGPGGRTLAGAAAGPAIARAAWFLPSRAAVLAVLVLALVLVSALVPLAIAGRLPPARAATGPATFEESMLPGAAAHDGPRVPPTAFAAFAWPGMSADPLPAAANLLGAQAAGEWMPPGSGPGDGPLAAGPAAGALVCGEGLFTREPADDRAGGAIAATDLLRLVAILLVLAGCLLESAGVHGLANLLRTR